MKMWNQAEGSDMKRVVNYVELTPLPPLVAADPFPPLEELFEAHHHDVWCFVARRAGRDAADEIAAEVFITAWKRRGAFDKAVGSVRAWLFGIALNHVRNHLRSERRAARALDRVAAELLVRAPGNIDATAPGAEQLRVVFAAVAKLRPEDRELLLLVAWEQLSYQEIATVLDIPIGTVRSRVARSRERLQRAVAKERGVPRG